MIQTCHESTGENPHDKQTTVVHVYVSYITSILSVEQGRRIDGVTHEGMELRF